MGQKKTLNEKRLTKKQVQEIIRIEGHLHEEFTKFFEETEPSGEVKQDKVYELPGDRFLYVFDDNDISTPGKGDIYPKEYFLKWVRWVARVRSDYANGRASSFDHWWYYSRYKSDILNNIESLIAELADSLRIDKQKLDRSYDSLDIVSTKCGEFEMEDIFNNFYDNLIAYTGEVIKKRVNGFWELNNINAREAYPFISIGLERVQYMPLNIVWSALDELEPINLRKEAANEIRRNAFRVKYEREFRNKVISIRKSDS